MEKKVMKQKHRKGLWSPEEDQKLKDCILNYGHGCWSSIPNNAGLYRNGKSCRLRWINYLRPGLKRGLFTLHEEETILRLHRMLGNKWSQMAQHFPGRTDNEIKNFWHSYLKKKVANKSISEADHDQTKSYSNNTTAESHSLSKQQELATTKFSDPQKTSSSHNVFSAEWLDLDVSNSLTTGIYRNQPLYCADPLGIYSDMLQDSTVKNALLSGDHGELNGRNKPFQEIVSKNNSTSYSSDIYGDMGESEMSENGLLDLEWYLQQQ